MFAVSLAHSSSRQAPGPGHSRSVLSQPSETMRRPSRLNAILSTAPVWPVSDSAVLAGSGGTDGLPLRPERCARELSWTHDCVVNISRDRQSERHTKDNVLRWHALNPLRSHKLVEARPWFV